MATTTENIASRITDILECYEGRIPSQAAKDLRYLAGKLDECALEVRNHALIRSAISILDKPVSDSDRRQFAESTDELLKLSEAIGDNRDADEK